MSQRRVDFQSISEPQSGGKSTAKKQKRTPGILPIVRSVNIRPEGLLVLMPQSLQLLLTLMLGDLATTLFLQITHFIDPVFVLLTPECRS